MRSDPFWEFGSFGLTWCHCGNLLHINNSYKLNGNRLAFCQNGGEGFKLILLTSPVKVINHENVNEVTWNKKNKPFKYLKAPLIINNKGKSEFPLIFESIKNVNRKTYVAKFSSAFRTRCYPLENELAKEVFHVFNRKYNKAIKSDFILNYSKALPYNPPNIDSNRILTFKNLLKDSDINYSKKKSKCRKC